MNSLNSVLVLLMLSIGFELGIGEELECRFIDKDFELVGELYSCFVTSLDNRNNNITITGSTGVHKTTKNDNDVKGIFIHDTNIKFIPAILGSLFNLSAFAAQSTHLIEIKAKDFQGMQNLECLNLGNNLLTTVPSDTFSALTKLRIVNLNYNQIEEVKNGLFDNNFNVEKINLQSNKIKFIGSELFKGLLKLNRVYLDNNNCATKQYVFITELTQLKQDIRANCYDPNEVSTTPTTQNPLEIMNIEMEERIKNLVKELSELKDEEQKKVILMIEITKENDLLKKELSKAKDKHKKEQLKNDKLEIELMKAKELRQVNQVAFNEMKIMLMKANERLSNCPK